MAPQVTEVKDRIMRIPNCSTLGMKITKRDFNVSKLELQFTNKEYSLNTTALSVYSALQLKYFRNGGKYFCGHCQVNVPVINGVLDTINHPPPVLFDLLLKYLGHTQVDYPHPFSVKKQCRLMCIVHGIKQTFHQSTFSLLHSILLLDFITP